MGWQRVHASLACGPGDSGKTVLWRNVEGTNLAVVWHFAQFVRPPCLEPWQPEQLAGVPAKRPPGWHAVQLSLV